MIKLRDEWRQTVNPASIGVALAAVLALIVLIALEPIRELLDSPRTWFLLLAALWAGFGVSLIRFGRRAVHFQSITLLAGYTLFALSNGFPDSAFESTEPIGMILLLVAVGHMLFRKEAKGLP